MSLGRKGPGASGQEAGARTPVMGVQISPPGPVRLVALVAVVYDPRTPSCSLGESGGNRTVTPRLLGDAYSPSKIKICMRVRTRCGNPAWICARGKSVSTANRCQFLSAMLNDNSLSIPTLCRCCENIHYTRRWQSFFRFVLLRGFETIPQLVVSFDTGHNILGYGCFFS